MSRKKAKKNTVGARRTWHRLDSFFTTDSGVQPTAIDGVPVYVPGKIQNQIVVMVPMTASPSQIEAVAKAIKGKIGTDPIVVTSNCRFMKLTPVDDYEVRHATAQPGTPVATAESSAAPVAVGGDGGGHVTDGLVAGDAVPTVPDGAAVGEVDPAAEPRPS